MRILVPLVFSLLVSAGSVLAQQPAAADKPPTMMLTGCLRSSGADTAIAGPTGRLYTLEVMEAPATPAPGATTSSAPSVTSKTTYSLSAPESVGLAKHADHEVQLTGRLQAPAAPPAKQASPSESPSKPGGAHRTFEVTALKMIAAKCK